MTSHKQRITEVINELKQAVGGEVRFDNLTRQLYATDASDYCKVPVGVVIPRDSDDIQAAVEIAARYKVPIIPRGGGSSLSGQTLGSGLVIDHSKYLDKIIEINAHEKWAQVESGVVLDALNRELVLDDLMVGPDPSSSMWATLGGMVGNNSTGSHSFKHGMIADHLMEMEVVLSDGSKVRFDGMDDQAVARLARKDTLEGRLYRKIPQLLSDYRKDIESDFPRIWRNVAGYRLSHMLTSHIKRQPFSLAPLISGSEGSLAIVTQLKLGVVSRPALANLIILHFPTVQRALEMVAPILEHQPSAIELMTSPSIMLADNHPGFRRQLRKFVTGHPGAILIVEFDAASQVEMAQHIDMFKAWLTRQGYGEPMTHCTTLHQINNVWQVRKSVLGLLLSKPGDAKLTRIIDDAAVPVERLAAYTQDVVAAGRKYGIDINFDAHASAGCLHMGVDINLKTREGLRCLELLSKDIMDIAIAHKGTTTGEHGEGLARSYFNERLYGSRLHQAFKEVKAAFDPGNLMNPHKVLNPIDPWDAGWLRYYPGYESPLAPAKTYLDFSNYGGMAGLVEMCNGMGVCRSQLSGTMCPTYRVTKDELHTTRGRANALRAALSGRLGPHGLASEALKQAMELCLECKACRNECGSKVDMAKLKYEFLAHFQARHGIPLRSRMIGRMDISSAVASKMPRLANRLYQNRHFRKMLDRTLWIDERRELPPLAGQTFQQWFDRRPKSTKVFDRSIILWDDCHISFHEPEIGIAAVRVLEAAGFEIKLLNGRRCCARAMISKGLLEQARNHARHNVRLLVEHARRGTPIVGIEPSCIACFRDEYPDLLGSEAARQVAGRSFFFEEFISDFIESGRGSLPFDHQESSRVIKLHTHCYQKAFGTAGKVVNMLKLLPNTIVEEIDSGCCGMAGAFGYEKEHYAISMAIGELSLFPAVRKTLPDVMIAAAGTSCRQQIGDGTRRKAVHPVVILAQSLSAKVS